MKTLLVLVASIALAGCGVETVGAAASGAAIKKREVEQGKKTMEQVQQKLNTSMEQVQQGAQAAEKDK